MFNAFLEARYPSGIGTNGNRVVAAVALPSTIPLASPKVADYSIRRQQVALLSCVVKAWLRPTPAITELNAFEASPGLIYASA